jgi:hypothetical protein
MLHNRELSVKSSRPVRVNRRINDEKRINESQSPWLISAYGAGHQHWAISLHGAEIGGTIATAAVTGVTQTGPNSATANVQLSFQAAPLYAQHQAAFDTVYAFENGRAMSALTQPGPIQAAFHSVIDKEGQQPEVYAERQAASEFEKDLWRRFWDLANDEKLAKERGVRAIHGDAPYMLMEPGRVYEICLRSTGEVIIIPGTRMAPPAE